MKAFIPILLVGCTAALAQTGLFEEDFESSASSAALERWTGTKRPSAGSSGAWAEIRGDGHSEGFRKSGAEQYLFVRDDSDSAQVNLLARWDGGGPVATVSFDFVEPEGPPGGPAIFRVGIGQNTDSERAVNVGLRDGHIDYDLRSAYQPGRLHSLVLVINNSPETVDYGGGLSIPSQHFDLYLDGTLLRAGIPFDTKDGSLPAGQPIDALRVLTYSEGTVGQEFCFDSIRVLDGARQP